jgi:probable F420-dependent oxidoreductase
MKFGFSLSGLGPRHYPEVSLAAEAAGYESVWLPDHLVLPAQLPASYLYSATGEPPISSDVPVYDPWVLLGMIAATTTSIRLGTNVYVLPLRHPIVTARAVLTVDRISRGRVTLGAGVGWLEEEFHIVGDSSKNRGRRTDEIIPLIRRLWTEEIITHHGTYYDLPPLRFEPKPFQQPIPIEIGGTSLPALRRAGTLGDGWIELGSRDTDEFTAMMRVVQGARREAGREDRPFIVTASLGTDLDSVQRAAELGVDRVMVAPGAFGEAATRQLYLDTVNRFADEVIAKL